MTLTKAHIVEAIAEQTGYPKNQSSEMIETLLEIINRTLNKDEKNIIKDVKNKKTIKDESPLPSLYSISNV